MSGIKKNNPFVKKDVEPNAPLLDHAASLNRYRFGEGASYDVFRIYGDCISVAQLHDIHIFVTIHDPYGYQILRVLTYNDDGTVCSSQLLSIINVPTNLLLSNLPVYTNRIEELHQFINFDILPPNG